ncbi:hypothetical protein [Yoonia sp. 2307UL14-13]|uniref:hypothetical protein n=1 Tax=Yoonia sp. 2307UL14-13 TaxID=3126506 RepID=UPI0030B7A75C
MALFQLTEAEERAAKKSLFQYIHDRALGRIGKIDHYCDSTWEQACRLLWRFDPGGRTQDGYSPTKTYAEISVTIDQSDLTSLPCLAAFLDTALCLNNHFHGIGAKRLSEPMMFDEALEPILRDLGLLDKDGTPTKPLLIDAIDRYHFFDQNSHKLSLEAQGFVTQLAEEVWRSASADDKAYLIDAFEMGKSTGLDNWLVSRWRFGEWLSDGAWEKDSELFGSHSAIGWLLIESIKRGLEEGRYPV